MSTVCGQDLLEWLLEEESNIASFQRLEDLVSKDLDRLHEARYVVSGPSKVTSKCEDASGHDMHEDSKQQCSDPNCVGGLEEHFVEGRNNMYRVLLERKGHDLPKLTSSGISPGLTGAGLGGSRCPYLDGLACGNLWLQRKSPAQDLFWVESSMRELQTHSARTEETLSSLWRLEPAKKRPSMGDVFVTSWEKSGADPALRSGVSLGTAAVDEDYLREMGFTIPGVVRDSGLIEDFDYIHVATSLSQSINGCGCRLCAAVDAVTRPLFARNVAVGDVGNLIVSAIVSVDLCLNARAAARSKGSAVSNGYIKFVPAVPSDCGHPKMKGNVFPKGDGVGQVRSAEMAKIFHTFEAKGIMRNTCVYSVGCAIDFFVYGGAYGGVWAMQDTQFLYDYAIGSRADCDAELKAIRNRCVKVADGAGHEYVGDGVTLKFANYVQIKFKMETEEAARSAGQKAPGYVVWDDLKAQCAFRCIDGVFANGLYDSRGDDASVIILGALVAVHDFIDLGYDIASGEIGNVVPSLCRGNVGPDPLKRAYARISALMVWAMENRKYEPDSLFILGTFIWQMSNARHRVMENASVVPESLRIRVGWRFQGVIPGYGDLVDDSQYIQQSPEKFEITIPWSGETVVGGDAVSKVVMQAKRPEEQEAIELFLVKFLTGAEQPDFEVYNPVALRLMCDDDWQRKVDFTWALCIAMYEEGIIYAASVSTLRITKSRPANDDRAGKGYEERVW